MPGGFEAGAGLPGAEEPTAALPGAEGEAPSTEAPTAGGDAGGETSPLLATPGKRDGRETAGKLKSYIGISTPEAMRGRTSRSKFPGKQDRDLLSKGIYTEQLSNYEEEEERIFSINYETQALIENLNNMESKSDET